MLSAHVQIPYDDVAGLPWLLPHLFKPLHHPGLTAIDLLQRWAQRRVHRRNVLRAADEVHLREGPTEKTAGI